MEPVFLTFTSSAGNWHNILLGKVIRFFTGGKCNHACVVYWDVNWASWLVVGANANGLTFQSLESFLKVHNIVGLFGSTQISLWDGLRAHVNDLNTGYNYSGLFNMAWVEVGKKITGKPWGNNLSNKHELFCSEWCSEVIRVAVSKVNLNKEWPLFDGYNDDQIDPAFLMDTVTSSKLWLPIDKDVLVKPWVYSI